MYESGPCLVVAKPPGLATQAPAPFDSLEVRLKQFLAGREGREGSVYLGVPHRLDRPVSGPVVFARNERAARKISRQFEQRTVRKVYWALVEGSVEPRWGTWIDWIKKVYGRPQSEIVPESAPDGRKAVLRYHTLGHVSRGTMLEIELETGRTHQIRVQAASRGHPVVGDVLYGAGAVFGQPPSNERDRVIALHGRLLEFNDPTSRERIRILAPFPPEWSEVLEVERTD